jgi:hypothetical protein
MFSHNDVQLFANYAIVLTFLVYCLLLVVAIYQIRQNTKATRDSSRQRLWSELLTDFRCINDFGAAHPEIPTQPYPAHSSKEATFTLLFHHLNLILRYWLNRTFLEADERVGFERWIDTIFFRWIASDPNLKTDFEGVLKERDLFPGPFLQWLANRQGATKILDGTLK